jgi:tryptophanyl-tRNA synthetase
MQHSYRCYFFIADWHSLTTHPRPENIKQSVKTILAEYLACGIDPEVATIYVQSDLTETLELYLYMNMNAYLGELQRVTSFKEKARKQPDNINAGLLTYPCLMAADILIHKAQHVPVGKDQEQNMEMARKFARRFNIMYETNYFPEPASFHFSEKAVKVPGLDGSGKMGKSEGNAIYLADDEKTIKKKIMKAVTDAGPKEPNSPKPEAVANLFALLDLVAERDTYQYFNEQYNRCTISYGDLKKQLAYDINLFCAPIRERIIQISSNEAELERVARIGLEKARAGASQTIKEVREILGFRF